MADAKPLQLTAPPENTVEECDAALGAYLRAWDQIDIQLIPLFTTMLGTHKNATQVLLRSGMSQPTLREILESLSSFRLKKKEQQKLAALLRRWKTASTKRNRIVHGYWQLNITMIEGPSGKRDHTRSYWVRFYPPSDPTIYNKLFGKKPNQKLVSEHIFKLSDITNAATHVRTLAQDIENFLESLSVLPFVDPQPLELEKTANEILIEKSGG